MLVLSLCSLVCFLIQESLQLNLCSSWPDRLHYSVGRTNVAGLILCLEQMDVNCRPWDE